MNGIGIGASIAAGIAIAIGLWLPELEVQEKLATLVFYPVVIGGISQVWLMAFRRS